MKNRNKKLRTINVGNKCYKWLVTNNKLTESGDSKNPLTLKIWDETKKLIYKGFEKTSVTPSSVKNHIEKTIKQNNND